MLMTAIKGSHAADACTSSSTVEKLKWRYDRSLGGEIIQLEKDTGTYWFGTVYN